MNNRIQYALRKQAGFKWDPNWNKYLVPGGVGIGTFVLARLLGANPWLAAGLGLAGAGGTSLYQNWDTLFPKGKDTAGGAAGSGNAQQAPAASPEFTQAALNRLNAAAAKAQSGFRDTRDRVLGRINPFTGKRNMTALDRAIGEGRRIYLENLERANRQAMQDYGAAPDPNLENNQEALKVSEAESRRGTHGY